MDSKVTPLSIAKNLSEVILTCIFIRNTAHSNCQYMLSGHTSSKQGSSRAQKFRELLGKVMVIQSIKWQEEIILHLDENPQHFASLLIL